MDEFFDAKSLLGSLQEAFASAMSASGVAASGLLASQHAGAAAGVPPDLDAFALHDLAASIREPGGPRAKRWSAALAAPSLTLSLFYPEAAGGGSPYFAPRLVAEAFDLDLQAEARTGGRWLEAGGVCCKAPGCSSALAGPC